MATNKVMYGDQTIIDLTQDTATVSDVASGKTFHDASGEIRVGTASGGGGGHTYSTSEQVVGTWLGETLYERSFVYSGNISNRDWVTIDNSYSPSNVGVFFLEHICFKISGLDTLYASYMGQTLDVGVETAANLYVENYTGETVTDAWFTIRYTKI